MQSALYPTKMLVSLSFLSSLAYFACGASIIGQPIPVSDSFLSPVLKKDEVEVDGKMMDALTLSSFELFSVTDLLMEITLRPCSHVNRPIMSSIKKFLVTGLSHAPVQSNRPHPEFYTTYHSLVNCLNYVDETYGKMKSLESPFAPAKKEASVVRRSKRDGVEENEIQDNHLTEDLLEESGIIDSNKSFENFFGLLLSITVGTCSKGMGAEIPVGFAAPLLMDVTHWARSQGTSVYKTAQLKYFYNTDVLEELSKCSRTIKPSP